MLSPPLRAMLWKSVGLALALIVVVAIALDRLIALAASAPAALPSSTASGRKRICRLTALAWLLSFAAGLGIIVGSVFLMPAVTALVASFFADQIADEVEREHYPADPPRHGAAAMAGAPRRRQDGVARGRGLYLRGAVLLFAGFGAVIFFLATAWLLGREYFELAAMRFRPPDEAQGVAQAQCRRPSISADC